MRLIAANCNYTEIVLIYVTDGDFLTSQRNRRLHYSWLPPKGFGDIIFPKGGTLMTLSEKLKQLRVEKGLTQEKLAELTGVSRQAVAKWENGQSRPTYENLAALESIYGLEPYRLSGENPPKKENKILQANLIKIAIIAQAACLNVAIQPLDEGFTGGMYIFALVFKYLPLFLASIWMSANMRYEKNLVQRRKNSIIELIYCLIQLAAALWGHYSGHLFVTACLLIAICYIYVAYINPRYMNRRLVERKNKYNG